MFINIPARYKFDTIDAAECADLIEKKLEKEENRFILNFPEQKISVENARWGPIIKFNKKIFKLTGKKIHT